MEIRDCVPFPSDAPPSHSRRARDKTADLVVPRAPPTLSRLLQDRRSPRAGSSSRATPRSSFVIPRAFGDGGAQDQAVQEGDDAVEELSWHGQRVVWTKDGSPYRSWTFNSSERVRPDEDEDVVQAFLCWFDVASAAESQPVDGTPATGNSNLQRDEELYGPYGQRRPPPWTSESSSASTSPSKEKLAPLRHLVVLFPSAAFVYPDPTLSMAGRAKVVQLSPTLKMEQAWPLKRGCLLQDTAGGCWTLTDPEAPMRRVSGLAADTRAPFLSSIRERFPSGYAPAVERVLYASTTHDGSEPFVVTCNQPSSAKAPAATIRIYRYTYQSSTVRPGESWEAGELAGDVDGVIAAYLGPAAATTAIEVRRQMETSFFDHAPSSPVEHRQPHGKTPPKRRSMSGGAVVGAKRKRSDVFEGASRPPLPARTDSSGPAAASTSYIPSHSMVAGPRLAMGTPAASHDLDNDLELVGASLGLSFRDGHPRHHGTAAGMRRTVSAMSAASSSATALSVLSSSTQQSALSSTSTVHGGAPLGEGGGNRRTSLLRGNELSASLDRMALGGAGSVGDTTEMLATTAGVMRDDNANELLDEHRAPEVTLELVTEFPFERSSSAEDEHVSLQACVFDVRSSERTCSLALHSSESQIVQLFTLSPTAISPAYTPRLPAAQVCAVLATRQGVLDLLVLSHRAGNFDAKLVTAKGRIASVTLPSHLASGVGIELHHAASDHSRSVLLAMRQRADGADERVLLRLPSPPRGLTRKALEVLSLVLNIDAFVAMQSAVDSRRRARGDWGALASTLMEKLSGRQSTGASEPLPVEDPIFASLALPAQTKVPPAITEAGWIEAFDDSQKVACLSALQLLLEDTRLQQDATSDTRKLGDLLLQAVTSMNLPRWVDALQRLGLQTDKGASKTSSAPSPLNGLLADPLDLLATLRLLISGTAVDRSNLDLAVIATACMVEPSGFYHESIDPCGVSRVVLQLYTALFCPVTPNSLPAFFHVLEEADWTKDKIHELAFGIAMPLREALRRAQLSPAEDFSKAAYEIMNRPDMAKLSHESTSVDGPDGVLVRNRLVSLWRDKFVEDGLEPRKSRNESDAPKVPAVKRFSEDRRIEEVARMLQTKKAAVIAPINPAAEGPGLINEVLQRTLALPIGQAIFLYQSSLKDFGSVSDVGSINTSVRVLPLGTPTLPDGSSISARERLEWSNFHNGVRAAISINARPDGDRVVQPLSRTSEPDARQAGFLLGLGLTGHLRELTFNQAFEYLKAKHDPTSIAVLLGLAATYRGTGDPKVTSLVSVHLAALHPPNSTPVNVSNMTQAAGLLSIGLLYMGTSRRSLADVMLRELCDTFVQSIEDPTACREAYALSAGFAFGMILLGQGNDRASIAQEAKLLRTFRSLILGESNHSLPGVKQPATMTDISITSPAATMALALMYLRTGRRDVADILEIPTSPNRLDYVRPDLLLCRTLGRALIMWDRIQPSKAWIESNVPGFLSPSAASKRQASHLETEFETARWSIITGAVMAVGLKYAGTARQDVHHTLLAYLDRLLKAASAKVSSIQAKVKRGAMRQCLGTVALALAMVMAGTGELDVLRRFRIMHGQFGEDVSFSSHVSTHMAVGLLFLGQGNFTLGTSDAAVASLLCAFFPSHPTSSHENRAHLQAYRHLWALAVEPRCMVARDVESDELAFLPIKVRVREVAPTLEPSIRANKLVTPTLFPEVQKLHSVVVDSPRYWAVALHFANPRHRAAFLSDSTIYVKRRTGHLSYAQDPRGFRNVFTKSKSETGSTVFDLGEVSKTLALSTSELRDFVSAFATQPEYLAMVRYLCHDGTGAASSLPTAHEAFSAAALLECLTGDKPDALEIYAAMHAAQSHASQPSFVSLQGIGQLTFLLDFYLRPAAKLWGQGSWARLIQPAFCEQIQLKLEHIAADMAARADLLAYLVLREWPTTTTASARLATALLLHRSPSAPALAALQGRVMQARATQVPADQAAALNRAIELSMRQLRAKWTDLGLGQWSAGLDQAMLEAWTA